MKMNRMSSLISAGLIVVPLLMLPLPVLAAHSAAPEPQTNEKLSNKQRKYLLHQATTPADHLRLAAYYRDKAQKLRDRAAAHDLEAGGYANRSLFEPKTGIAGGLLRHCREWAWRYAQEAKRYDALAEVQEKLAREMSNAVETAPHPREPRYRQNTAYDAAAHV